LERAKTSSEGENEITRDFKSEITREDFERSGVDSSRVREFELDSGVLPTVKSETNKESENRVAESVISQQVPPSRYNI
jgi:hypothetical protein